MSTRGLLPWNEEASGTDQPAHGLLLIPADLFRTPEELVGDIQESCCGSMVGDQLTGSAKASLVSSDAIDRTLQIEERDLPWESLRPLRSDSRRRQVLSTRPALAPKPRSSLMMTFRSRRSRASSPEAGADNRDVAR